jgi:hypothetical protein
MTTPPDRLVNSYFWFDGVMELRSETGALMSKINAGEALALAYRGEIEGVGSRNGKIKYLRYLPPSARRNPTEQPHREETYQSSSDGFARTNLGVYREPIIQTHLTAPTAVAGAFAAGVIIGYCYAHCQLREAGL